MRRQGTLRAGESGGYLSLPRDDTLALRYFVLFLRLPPPPKQHSIVTLCNVRHLNHSRFLFYATTEPEAGISKESEVDSASLGSRQNLAGARHANAKRGPPGVRGGVRSARCGCVCEAHSIVLNVVAARKGYAGYAEGDFMRIRDRQPLLYGTFGGLSFTNTSSARGALR